MIFISCWFHHAIICSLIGQKTSKNQKLVQKNVNWRLLQPWRFHPLQQGFTVGFSGWFGFIFSQLIFQVSDLFNYDTENIFKILHNSLRRLFLFSINDKSYSSSEIINKLFKLSIFFILWTNYQSKVSMIKVGILDIQSFLWIYEDSNLKPIYLNGHPLLLPRLEHCIQNSNISSAFNIRKARLNLVATILLQINEKNDETSKHSDKQLLQLCHSRQRK